MTKHITGKNGSPVSDKATVNFVEGSNITLTVTEDADSVNVQIDGSAGGSGDVATDAIFDAKGDLPVGTGANTAAKLTAGADDTILMADSAQATGLKWVASASPSAIDTSAATGTSDTFTRGDHVHAHEAAHINHDTTWAAKGDLIAGTANDTAAVLSVGTNAYVPVASSGASTGLAWEAKTAGAAADYVTTAETTTSSSYTDLATAGPAVTVTVGLSGMCLVSIYRNANNDNASGYAFMGFSIDGAAAADSQAIGHGAVAGGSMRAGGTFLLTGLSAGSHTFTAKYKALVAGTAAYSERRILAVPL